MSQSLYLQVLVIDSTLAVAAKTLSALKRVGITPHHAISGHDALAYLEVKQPDVILLALDVDDISGWELLQKARARYGAGHGPLLVTTAYHDDKAPTGLGRPFAKQHLIDTIKHVIDLRKRP